MRDKWEAIFFLIVVIAPLVRWIFERITGKQEAKRETARRTLREARRETTAEEEELPSWFDEDQWEVVEEKPEPPPLPATPRSSEVSVRSPIVTSSPRRSSTSEIRPSRPSLLEPTRRRPPQRKRSAKPRVQSPLGRVAQMDELRKAIIYTEILGPPRGMRPHSDDR